MQRRSFLGMLGAAGAAGMLPVLQAGGAETEKRTRFYAFDRFYMRQGTQPARLHEYFSKAVLPALDKVHSGPKIFLEALVAPHMPQVAIFVGFQSLEEMWRGHTVLGQDKELAKAAEQWEGGPEPPFEEQANVVLEAADYSPEIVAPAEPRKTSRIFELRVYHSPTWLHLQALHERFSTQEIKIFHRVGIHPVLYGHTIFGPNMPNLTYLTPFENLAAREKAWEAFGADPEWAKVRKESVEKHGQIVQTIQLSLFRATAYSPIR